jgi:Cytochrome P450
MTKSTRRTRSWERSRNEKGHAVDDPERFDVSRQKVAHQAFGGGGAHFCLGNGLARLELRVPFEELMRRVPDMQIAGPITRLTSNFSNELTSMPVTFTPGKREGCALVARRINPWPLLVWEVAADTPPTT